MEKMAAIVVCDNFDSLDGLCSLEGMEILGVFNTFPEASRYLDNLVLGGRMPHVALIDGRMKREYLQSPVRLTLEKDYTITPLFVRQPGEAVEDDDYMSVFHPLSVSQITEMARIYERDTELRGSLEFLRGKMIEEGDKAWTGLHMSLMDEQFKTTKRLQQLMVATIQQTIEGIVLVSPKGVVEYLNTAFEKLIGRQRADIIGKHIKHFSSDRLSASLLHALKKIALGKKPWKGNIKLDERMYDIFVGAIRNREERVLGYAAIFSDVSSREHAGRKFIREQRMEALATLAGGIAHDFNNVILAMQANVEALEECLDADAPGRKYLERMLGACGRAGAMVRKFLNFSRSHKDERRMVSVGETVMEVVELLQAATPDDIEFKLELEQDTSRIFASDCGVYEIVMNLLRNAVDALNGRPGMIMVSLHDEALAAGNSFGLPPGNYVKLVVADTGDGISEELAQRIFEPFFTTKQEGKGNGLGLSVVHEIVESLNGHIGVRSRPEESTRFYIYLPADPVEEGTAEEIPEPETGEIEHILWICEQPEGEGAELPGFLRSEGFRVSVINGADDAVSAFMREPLKYDMLVSDKVLRTAGGASVFKHVFAVRPDIPAILLTHYSDTIELSLGVMNKLVMLLKPVEASVLNDTVKVLFGKRRLAARLVSGGD